MRDRKEAGGCGRCSVGCMLLILSALGFDSVLFCVLLLIFLGVVEVFGVFVDFFLLFDLLGFLRL